jgi:hypothetical protein
MLEPADARLLVEKTESWRAALRNLASTSVRTHKDFGELWTDAVQHTVAAGNLGSFWPYRGRVSKSRHLSHHRG